MPHRPLITDAHVREAARAGRPLVVAPGALVTPLARDTARELKVAFVAPAAATPTPAGPSSPLAPKRIALGSDHGGFALKTQLLPFVKEMGWDVLDLGTDSEASVDYPVFAYAVGRAVALGQARLGIMIDGAGLGSAMVCNKIPGIRAACAYNSFTAWNARAHNDANVLTLGSRTLGVEVCKFVVKMFLETSFEGGRHEARVALIDDVGRRFLGEKG